MNSHINIKKLREIHIEMHKWLQAIHLMVSSKKGISAHQLHRVLEITHKSAWFMARRIREAIRTDGSFEFGSGGSVVEVDETYIGREPGRKKNKGWGHKMKVVSLVDRSTGQSRNFVVDKVNKATLLPTLRENIAKEARVMTDEASWYRNLGTEFASHDSVDHGAGEYGRGDIHTNTVEGYYSIFKRGMRGVYQHCGKRHLHRYAAEFEFRYNNRVTNGKDDSCRAAIALRGMVGKRLKYRGSSLA